MAHQLNTNTSTLQFVLNTINSLPPAIDITTPLAELNAANGGTAATTIDEAVDNTEAHASSQEAMIEQIINTLDGKIGGESNLTIATASTTLTADNFSISFTGVNKQPKLFIVHSTIEQFSMDTTKNLCCVFYNGTTTSGISGRRGTLAPQIFHDTGGYTWTYNNGTLTVSSSDGYGEFTSDVPFLLTYIA